MVKWKERGARRDGDAERRRSKVKWQVSGGREGWRDMRKMAMDIGIDTLLTHTNTDPLFYRFRGCERGHEGREGGGWKSRIKKWKEEDDKVDSVKVKYDKTEGQVKKKKKTRKRLKKKEYLLIKPVNSLCLPITVYSLIIHLLYTCLVFFSLLPSIPHSLFHCLTTFLSFPHQTLSHHHHHLNKPRLHCVPSVFPHK